MSSDRRDPPRRDGTTDLDLREQPHRRWNPLKREWVLVSPHRTQRPWQGQTETPAQPAALQYDPDVLSVSWQCARGWHVTTEVHQHLCL